MPTMWSVLRASGVLVPARVFNMLVDLAALALVDLALARLTAPLQGHSPINHQVQLTLTVVTFTKVKSSQLSTSEVKPAIHISGEGEVLLIIILKPLVLDPI